MSDIINRQDAIDAVNAYLGLSAVSRTIQNMTSIQEILENLPSAQPEERTEERTESHGVCLDVISRQAAIDALIRKMRPHDNGDGTMTICAMSEGLVRETLNDLPSA